MRSNSQGVIQDSISYLLQTTGPGFEELLVQLKPGGNRGPIRTSGDLAVCLAACILVSAKLFGVRTIGENAPRVLPLAIHDLNAKRHLPLAIGQLSGL